MPGFVIKNLPRDLHRRLKAQAAQHRRSMTKEALALLEQALAAPAEQPKAPPPFRGRFALTDKFLDEAKRKGRA
ncbi:MAG: FitA-like ribbon-helix-helix domain-containing protein [Betaproteobacteria bacterium]